MRASTATSALVALAVLAPLVLGVTSETRHVQRGIASPLDRVPDASHWRVEVPAGHAVRVRADAANGTFVLRWCLHGTACAERLPTTATDIELQTQQTDESWTVTVDPTIGARLDVTVVFDGFLVDQGNAPGDFTLVDLPRDEPCLGGECLP